MSCSLPSLIFLLMLESISKFRKGGEGGKEVMPPKMPKVALFALHMQCVVNMCSKTNKIYCLSNAMHSIGQSRKKKSPECPCVRACVRPSVRPCV